MAAPNCKLTVQCGSGHHECREFSELETMDSPYRLVNRWGIWCPQFQHSEAIWGIEIPAHSKFTVQLEKVQQLNVTVSATFFEELIIELDDGKQLHRKAQYLFFDLMVF